MKGNYVKKNKFVVYFLFKLLKGKRDFIGVVD